MSIKSELIRIVTIILKIMISLSVIYFFIWGGLKGIIGFCVGVLVTGYIFLSESAMMQLFRDYVLGKQEDEK